MSEGYEKIGVILHRGGFGAALFLMSVAVLYSMFKGTSDRYTGADAKRDWSKQDLVNERVMTDVSNLRELVINHLSSGAHRDAARDLARINAILEATMKRLDRLEDK